MVRCNAYKEPNGVALELLTLATSGRREMPCRPCQVRDRGLERIAIIIQRQQRVPSKGDDRRRLFLGQDCRPWFLRPGLEVFDLNALARLRHRFGVYAEFPAQLRERSLRLLYCCSDGVRSRNELVPWCLLPLPRKDHTNKP